MTFGLSALALLDELRLSSRSHQFTEFDAGDPGKEEACLREIRSRDMIPLDFSFKGEGQKTATRPTSFTFSNGRLLREFCQSHIPEGGKNFVWLKQMVEARERLGKFWEGTRSDLRVRQNALKRSETYTNILIGHMSYDLAAGYLAEAELERHELEVEYRRERARKEQQHREKSAQFVQQSWDNASMPEDGLVRKKITKKPKSTNNSPRLEDDLQSLTVTDDHVNGTEPTDEGESPSSQLQVKQDTLSVVQKMFPSSTASVKKGGVRWTNFVQALTDSGMVATQGAGSAVTFANAQGRIVFHEPHPEPTIDAVLLRSFGQRLRKWFGWSNETFVLRPRGGEETQKGE